MPSRHTGPGLCRVPAKGPCKPVPPVAQKVVDADLMGQTLLSVAGVDRAHPQKDPKIQQLPADGAIAPAATRRTVALTLPPYSFDGLVSVTWAVTAGYLAGLLPRAQEHE